ncbi:formyl-CoA transferase [Jatrophihabitans sp. GAS493]|uniref:CaiB/BaiF CoA transferase family protein n=1 Tax=Jatrophihabitans sp. GAS493 TaxID=1907575 RepID=UPI000BB91DD8|nr:CoA transferase [Jatrophihabitans sp. GAS493]SOD71791.1 formyl-CoA transferase [Jatrophihabitans sp. GAS493]
MTTQQKQSQPPSDRAARGQGPLAGVKVLELAHLVAGPMAGTLLADLGAEVVHVEDPKVGDAARRQGPLKDGTHLWWKVSGRNKRSVTIDLRQPAGQALAHELVGWADVLITNMRVNTLRKWELDWESLHVRHPKLVMLHVSGNGLAAASANEPGFGKVGEARSGVVAVTGFADAPPVHAGFSHADTVTALMGAFGICAAMVDRLDPDFQGELIDLALDESLFRLIDWQVVVADQLGYAPPRAGNQLAIAPGVLVNTYESADGRWLTVTSGTPRSVMNIATLIGQDPADFQTQQQLRERVPELDARLRDWISERKLDDALAAMKECEVVAAPVLSGMDILVDPLFAERGDIITIADEDLGPLRMQGVIPRLVRRPGSVRRTGPQLGADTDDVLRSLGHSEDELAGWRADGVV